MKQRLGIAQALLGSPKLLICDEPTSALDPVGRKEILDILLAVKDRTTVLFSTHILSDVERICTDVALLNGGKIAMQGPIDQLKRTRRKEEFSVEMSDGAGVEGLAEKFADARLSDGDTLVFDGGEERMYEVLDFIRLNSLSLRKIEKLEGSLETLFMEVVGK